MWIQIRILLSNSKKRLCQDIFDKLFFYIIMLLHNSTFCLVAKRAPKYFESDNFLHNKQQVQLTTYCVIVSTWRQWILLNSMYVRMCNKKVPFPVPFRSVPNSKFWRRTFYFSQDIMIMMRIFEECCRVLCTKHQEGTYHQSISAAIKRNPHRASANRQGKKETSNHGSVLDTHRVLR